MISMKPVFRALTLALTLSSVPAYGIDFGPADIDISKADWLALQRYTTNARHLPHTEDELRTDLELGSAEDLEKFIPLLKVNQSIRASATIWDEESYPQMLSVLNDLHRYARLVPARYARLQELIGVLIEGPDNETARLEFMDMLHGISTELGTYIARVDQAHHALANFAEWTARDEAVLVQLRSFYGDLIKMEEGEAQRLALAIERLRGAIDILHQEYDHYVVVAATTPTYAWIWPFGTIAAGVTAGIYGDKARKALDNIHQLEAQMKDKSAEEQRAYQLKEHFSQAERSVQSSDDLALQMQKPLQAIRGRWSLLKGDVDGIAELMDDGLDQHDLTLLQQLQVGGAIDKWQTVDAEVEGFLANAEIQVHGI